MANINIFFIVITLEVFQFDNDWLKFVALLNVPVKSVIFDIFQFDIFWLNDVAPLKVFFNDNIVEGNEVGTLIKLVAL